MKKNTMKSNIATINKLSTRIPKSINEAINFNEDDDMDMMDDEPMDEPMDNQFRKHVHAEPAHEDEPNIDNFIANMRKESLSIMKSLADDPDNAVYQFAKKIFQLADKAHEDKKEGKNINGQPQQRQEEL